VQDLAGDIRYAFRTLFRQPGFTLVAALSLALGIGLHTTIFSVVNTILLKNLPIEDPGRLVETGSIETGKLADLVVLESNLFDIPPENISETRVLMTFLESEPVFRAEEF